MRSCLPLGLSETIRWSALRPEGTFLFRRIGDRGRAVLGIGLRAEVDRPRFGTDGRVHDWTFGHLLYDAANGPDLMTSRHRADPLPASHWWVPRWVVEWRAGEAYLHVLPGDEQAGRAMADELLAPAEADAPARRIEWQRSTSFERYLGQVEVLLRHIRRGDIYEVNYCTERHAAWDDLDPFRAVDLLLKRTRAPFAAFHRLGDHFALCASPERFLAFDGRRVVGQPMKGTRPRSTDPVEDARLAAELAHDAKERSENIMALDVMRHDLSRIAASRSVQVEELCAVHAHPAVHQMTSTVSAMLRPGLDPMDAVRAAFPMASMTGAPKLRAMQLIDEVEDQGRGLFSGTLGFFAPDGTADLNVVIRTVRFDAGTGRASLTTGSALTAACDPSQEWAECELKARSVIDALCHA